MSSDIATPTVIKPSKTISKPSPKTSTTTMTKRLGIKLHNPMTRDLLNKSITLCLKCATILGQEKLRENLLFGVSEGIAFHLLEKRGQARCSDKEALNHKTHPNIPNDEIGQPLIEATRNAWNMLLKVQDLRSDETVQDFRESQKKLNDVLESVRAAKLPELPAAKHSSEGITYQWELQKISNSNAWLKNP